MTSIAHILTSLSPQYGGPPKVAEGLAAGMAGYDCDISFYATLSGQRQADHNRSNVHLHARSWPRSWYRAPGLEAELRQMIDSLDLLHIHEVWSHPQYAASRIALRNDIPYVVCPHGELQHARMCHKSLATRLKKLAYLSVCGRETLRRAACLHAITPNEIEGFRQAGYHGPVAVVPNGIDIDQFTQLPAPASAEELWPELKNRRVVLFMSRLSPEKGLDVLLPAWGELLARGNCEDAILVLAGPDDRGYAQRVREMIDAARIASNVLLTGMVKGQRKLSLMSRADLYTLPSHTEGFSIAILENLAAGTPILLTPGCNFPEVAQAGAGLCANTTSHEIADTLQELLEMSQGQRDLMGKRGQRLVRENYTWQIAARKMITVYQSILSGKQIPLHPEPVPLHRHAA